MDGHHVYLHRPDLMTAEEIEDLDHVADWPPHVSELLMLNPLRELDVGLCREQFEHRPPALGFNATQIGLLEEWAEADLRPVDRRAYYSALRRQMLGNFTPCSGCANVFDLLAVLRAELERGAPAPLPDWYDFSSSAPGPRGVGYKACDARGCLRPEGLDDKFGHCTGCHLVYYCSPDCQCADWSARHAHVCAAGGGGGSRHVSHMLAPLSEMPLAEQGDLMRGHPGGLGAVLAAADGNAPGVDRRGGGRRPKRGAARTAAASSSESDSSSARVLPPPSGDLLVDAVVRVRHEAQRPLAVSDVHELLARESEWGATCLADVKRACVKATKLVARAAGQREFYNHISF